MVLTVTLGNAQQPGILPLPTPSGAGAVVSEDVLSAISASGEASVIIVYQTQSSIREADYTKEIAQAGNIVLESVMPRGFAPKVQYSHLPVLAGSVNAAALEALLANPLVTHVTLNRPVFAHDVESDALTHASSVHAIDGVTGSGVVVTILDTGIDSDHPDLVSSIAQQACFIECPVPGPGVWIAEDGNGHGTHAAGIITGANGVAPGAGVNMIRVLNNFGAGADSSVLNGLNYIVAADDLLQTDIVSMSLGGMAAYSTEGSCDTDNPAYKTAFDSIRALGIAIFVSTGNDGSTSAISAPGCITGAIGVGSVGDAAFSKGFMACTDDALPDKVSCFSNTTSVQGTGEVVDLLAPGCNILSTAVGGGHVEACGTSMATPMAAGIGALMLQAAPGLTPDELENLLETTGAPVTDYRIVGSPAYPRVDALAAYSTLQVIRGPDNLKVKMLSTTKNKLSWTNVSGETGYIIQRSNNGLAFIQIGTKAADETTFNDANAACGQNYYRVQSVTGATVSLSSNVIQVTNRACPLAPTHLTLSRASSSEFLLRWKDNASDETGYSIERAVGLLYEVVGTSAMNTRKAVVGAPDCNTQIYRVRAVRSGDYSPYSNLVSGLPCTPDNDVYTDATPITNASTNILQSDARYATSAADDPIYSCTFGGAEFGGNTVWYKFTPAADGLLTNINTFDSTGIFSDTMLNILVRTSTGWSEIACNDEDESGYSTSEITNLWISAGATYYIQLSKWKADSRDEGILAVNLTADVPIARELVGNGGFEAGLNQWTLSNPTKDKQKCAPDASTYSFQGWCAFAFRGSAGENSKLSQILDISGVTFHTGDSLLLNARTVATNAAASGKLIAVVTYSDGTARTKIVVPLGASPEYIWNSKEETLSSGAVSKVKVTVRHTSAAGLLYIDNVSLLHREAGARRSALPAPQPPSNFRGNN